MQLKALLLDLDGTLVDTAPDMVATLNRIDGCMISPQEIYERLIKEA